VHYRTAGNPYWTSLLGRGMWEQAPRRRDGTVFYHPTLLEKAVDELFVREKIIFEDRLSAPRDSSRPDLVQALLATLATAPAREGQRAMGLSSLHQALEERATPVDREELRRTLDYLQEQGSVREERIRERPSWKISAPLLAEYLRYLHADDDLGGEGAPR
jgi:hypothetical protein